MDVDDDVTDDTLSSTANAGAKRSRATSGNRASAAAEIPPLVMWRYLGGNPSQFYRIIAPGQRQCLLCAQCVTMPDGAGKWNWKRHLSRAHPYFLSEEDCKTNYDGKKPSLDAPSSASSATDLLSPAASALEAGVTAVREDRRPTTTQAITRFFAPQYVESD